ncbi:hypothetical protein [Francisella sciaenopsi]|uniref:Lipoprotein n=1 Tax=Francisella sciaenopsi TaxID=3055034 RepID=A0ABQ6PEP7_9GAMM
MFKKVVIITFCILLLASCAKSRQDMIKLTAKNYEVNPNQVKLDKIISNDPGGVGVYVWQAEINDKMVVCDYFPNFMLKFNYNALQCSIPKEKITD